MAWFKENGTKGSKEVNMKRRERITMRTFRRSLKRREAPAERLARKRAVVVAATASLFAATLAPLSLPGATALAESVNVKFCDLDPSDEGGLDKVIIHKDGRVTRSHHTNAKCGQGFPVAGD